ncbi:hypothetical protein [Haploplasma axanthum]|uniref:Uncharacterized protein n=1 Tax=Haploplasma axanthum TaxID=29552 RepID=A0A449BEI9_HAPAX|nr:hypothetical protein [Haploplasma axanthum]VEU80873.1 Uncharacterised protein [Haploplasma axanthum]
MKIFKKVPWVSIVLGSLLLLYGFISYMVDKGVFSLTTTVGNIVIAVGLIVFAVLFVLPKISKNVSKLSKTLRTTEFIILLVAAILGFILPLFGENIVNLGNGSLWFGIALVMDGGIGLYLGTEGKVSARGWRFLAYFVSTIMGTWIYAKNFIDSNIKIATFAALVLTGLYLLVVGLIHLKKPSKDRKQE